MGKTVAELAADTGLSRSAVSRILRHCGGVDYCTRQLILDRAAAAEAAEAAIYCILPDVPNFFWRAAAAAVSAGKKRSPHPIKLNLYTQYGDDETVLCYLEEAKQLGARVLILTARLSPAVRARLEELLPGRLVILLSEEEPLPNAFFVGSDARADGAAMARHLLEAAPGRRVAVLTWNGSQTERLRVQGFLDAVGREDVLTILPGDLSRFDRNFAARAARLLASRLDPAADYALYVPCILPQLPILLGKAAARPGQILCGCHDCTITRQEAENGLAYSLPVVCRQDLSAQIFTALQAAETYLLTATYPPQKRLFLPSRITGPLDC